MFAVLLNAGVLIGTPAWARGSAEAPAVPVTESSSASSSDETSGISPDIQAEISADAAIAPSAEAEPAENLGFPQLKTDTYASQVFWLLISFVLLYTLMSKLALPRVAEVLEKRQSLKEGDLAKAEQLSDEAEKIKTAYQAGLNKAQQTAQDVMTLTEQKSAEKFAAELAKFSEGARARIATAEKNIATAKQEALSSLADISAEVAVDMVGKIADVQVSKPDAKKIVTSLMSGA
jgi:F-type H+-transporting ATPase subunit b